MALYPNQQKRWGKPQAKLPFPEAVANKVLRDAQGLLQGCFPCASSLQTARARGRSQIGMCHFWGGIFQLQVRSSWNRLGCNVSAFEVGADDLGTHTHAHALEIFFVMGWNQYLLHHPENSRQPMRGYVCFLNMLNIQKEHWAHKTIQLTQRTAASQISGFPADADLGMTDGDRIGQVCVQKPVAGPWLGGTALLPEQSALNLTDKPWLCTPMKRRHHPLAYACIYLSYL